jgi:formate hydrogenlyase subunit 6/NADH:ubiquinone oxidoreductase subunit I
MTSYGSSLSAADKHEFHRWATLKRKQLYRNITRGRIENDIAGCIFCGLCATCAIVVAKKNREWEIDRLECCLCNLCVYPSVVDACSSLVILSYSVI